jgi:hypothetical protein
VIAFALGILRTTAVAPRLGELAGVMLETPVVLVVSWLVSAWCVTRFRVAVALPPRLAMGAVAFALLMGAEFSLSAVLFGRSPGDQLAAFLTPPGALGLAAQVGFAFMPLLQTLRPPR